MIFTSEDGIINGEGYHECALIRMDGENWDSQEDEVKNELTVEKTNEFTGWDDWKEQNKKGFDSRISFERKGNRLMMTTDNRGIKIRNITHLSSDVKVYAALTGDQVALTDIRIVR